MVHVSGPSNRERDPEIVGDVTADGRFWLQERDCPTTWISSDLALHREDWR